MAGASSSFSSAATLVQRLVEQPPRLAQVLRDDGERARLLQRARQLGLHAVEDRPAREGVHPLERHDLLARLEPVDRAEQELVRAHGELLERRHGVGARGQPVARERRERPGARLVEAVGRRPLLLPPREAPEERAAQRGVQLEEIARAALRLGRALEPEQPAEHGEVVLGVVDGARGIGRRGPREPRAGFGERLVLELLEVGHAAGERALDVERVERRHARARLGEVHARIREVQPLGRRAGREPQQRALGRRPVLARGQGEGGAGAGADGTGTRCSGETGVTP